MKPKVWVTRRIPQPALERLVTACDLSVWDNPLPPSYEILTEQIRGVEGLLCLLTDRIDAALMDAAGSQLKVISQMAVGYDNIEINAARQRGIPVGNTPNVLTDATADLTMALLLASARRLLEGVAYIKNDQWKTWEPLGLLGADVTGATLGIIGLGRIGQALAKRASGFEMRILAHNPTPKQVVGVELVNLDELLAESDFVSLHVPYNEQTHHLINAQRLARMKRNAILINTSRGGVIDQTALYGAIIQKVIRGAALDVTTPEPLPATHPLLELPNVLIVPHIGSASHQTRLKMANMAVDNLLAGLKGLPLPYGVG